MQVAKLMEVADKYFSSPAEPNSWPQPSGKDRVEGQYSIIELEKIGEIRSLSIVTRKVSVETLFFYPIAEMAAPIFAFELVNLNDKRFVVAIDAPSVYESTSQASAICSNAKATFTCLFGDGACSDEIPDWYRDCSSGFQVFSKSGDKEEFDALSSKALTCWTNFASSLSKNHEASQLESAESIHKHYISIQKYKQHHLINSPGTPMMNSFFGVSWTEKFMAEVFFK